MSVIAVSDLHIASKSDPLYASLLKLIRERARPGDTLILGGDIFDIFIGNKRIFRERYADFLGALRDALAHKVNVHYIEGNHDFQLGAVFRDLEGLKLHPRSVSLEIEGRRFFFAHGDLADRADYGYRFLRGFLRSPVMKGFVAAAPGSWIDGIGRKSSGYSRGTKPRLAANLPPDHRERLRKIYRSYAAEQLARGYDFVVLGHCHDLDEMSFNVAGKLGQYVNIGFPPVHGSYVEWSPGEAKFLRTAMP